VKAGGETLEQSMRFDRVPLGPVRAAARSGRELLTDEAERAIDGVLAGPLPERFARSLVENHVIERVVAELLTSAPSGDGALPQIERLAEEVTERVVRSPAFKHAMTEVLESPEIRRALSEQTRGFGTEFAAAARRRAHSGDDNVEARIRRRPREVRSPFAGFVTRGVALVVDAALAQVVFLVAAASVALVAALVAPLRSDWITGTVTGVVWLLVVAFYFVGFWSSAGQTPGMRFMHLRLLTHDGKPLTVSRACVRLVGLILAIIPLFAGFVPVLFDSRRRALQDFIARTFVSYEP
jgi:uncharacterized RDD family membrane protein YckC